jgi:hypothetical protein
MGGWGKDLIVEITEPFNSSRQTPRQGRHVQLGLVSPSVLQTAIPS